MGVIQTKAPYDDPILRDAARLDRAFQEGFDDGWTAYPSMEYVEFNETARTAYLSGYKYGQQVLLEMLTTDNPLKPEQARLYAG